MPLGLLVILSAVPMHPDKTGCRVHVDYAVHVFEMPVCVILAALPPMVSLECNSAGATSRHWPGCDFISVRGRGALKGHPHSDRAWQ